MDEPNHDVDVESRDVDPRLLAALGAGLAGLVALTIVVIHLAYPQSRGDQGGPGPRRPLPPEPRLQVDDAADLAAMRRSQADRLSSYGWGDRSSGIVHMPIDAAMRQAAERGLRDWPKADR